MADTWMASPNQCLLQRGAYREAIFLRAVPDEASAFNAQDALVETRAMTCILLVMISVLIIGALMVMREISTSVVANARSQSEKEEGSMQNLVAGCLGNVLEFYDFSMYGFFASEISRALLPPRNKVVALMVVFAMFWGAFLVRPLGGLLFGYVGDRFGRVVALKWSVGLMVFSTFCLGIIPSFSQVGWLAVVLLVVARLLQGVSCGGQLVGSMLFLLERCPPNKRGATSGLLSSTMNLGTLSGSCVGALLHSGFPTSATLSWYWRVPFILSIVLGWFTYLLLARAEEAHEFVLAQEEEGPGRHKLIKEAVLGHWRAIFQIVVGTALGSGAFYIVFVWMPTYLHDLQPQGGLASAFVLNTCGITMLGLSILVWGWAADWWEFRQDTQLLFATLTFGAIAPLVCRLFEYGHVVSILTAYCLVSAVLGAYSSIISAWLVAQVPDVTHRYAAIGVGFNINCAIWGGTAPGIATLLSSTFDGLWACGVYLSGLALIAASIPAFNLLRQSQAAD